MFIYGCLQGSEDVIHAHPCFICKKMIINSGIERVVVSHPEDRIRVYRVEDWVNDWREHDIIEDKERYRG